MNDREERDDEADAQAAMRIIEVTQSGVDSVGLVMVVATTAANCHDSKATDGSQINPELRWNDKFRGILQRSPTL